MVTAIIIAGGVGHRMGQDVPKQFIEVDGKPVIAYTLEAFERHPQVDAIEVVCLEGWQDRLVSYTREFGIGKLRWVTTGGATSQESIRNGVFNLEGELAAADIVIVHDGVRPMLAPEVITDVIRVCQERGNAVSSMPYNEQIFLVNEDDPATTTAFIPRETLRRVSTPQAYRFGLLDAAYREAFERGIGIGPSDYANTMMVQLGHRLHFAKGSDRNVKLTTPENLEFFRAWARGIGKANGREGSAR